MRTIEKDRSEGTLLDCIKPGLYNKTGNDITNFGERLSAIEGKLAQEITKDIYDLGFTISPSDYDEMTLEQNITRFLLELGTRAYLLKD